MNILKIIKSYQESKHIADEHEDKLFKMIYPNIEISRFQYDSIVEAIIKKFKKLGISYGTAKEILSTVSNKIDQEMEKRKYEQRSCKMRIHNNAELVRMPYLKKTDVGRISGYTRKDLNTLFDAAQEIDKKELGINYLFSYKVRTKTIAKLMGYSLKELMNMYPEQNKNAPSVERVSA